MTAPSEISIHFAEHVPPISCRSVAEMDAALDRLHVDPLRARDSGPPLAVAIVIPGYQIVTGLGADLSFVCVSVEPCDGEYYIAVGDEKAKGECWMFHGAGQNSYWVPKNMIPLPAARHAVRHFVENQQRSRALRWQDWAERDE